MPLARDIGNTMPYKYSLVPDRRRREQELRTHLQEVRKQKHETPDPTITTLENRSQMLFTQILDLRLTKIFRLLSLEDTQRFEKNMSDEEKWLFQRLHSHVLSWRSQILQ